MTPTLPQDPSFSRSSTGTGSNQKVLGIASWIVQILAGAFLLMAGFSKLRGKPEMVGAFEAIGAGQWFRYLTGALEVIGAVLIVIPRFIGVGAVLLGTVMVGAVATHLFILGGSALVPLALVVAFAFVAWVRRAQLQALVARARG